jgi:hypothetical protein
VGKEDGCRLGATDGYSVGACWSRAQGTLSQHTHCAILYGRVEALLTSDGVTDGERMGATVGWTDGTCLMPVQSISVRGSIKQ